MKKKIIYIYPDDTSFIRKDINFLSKKYSVLIYPQDWSKKKYILTNLFFQFIFLMRSTSKSSAIFVMFGGYWSLVPALVGKIFRKPVYIILGGTDCVSFPEFNYGSLRKPWLKLYIRWSYQLASKLLPIDGSLVLSEYVYDGNLKEKRQGYKHYFPNLNTPYKIIPNGFDASFWRWDGKIKNHNQLITIAKVNDLVRFQIKGIDLVLKLAKFYSNYCFHVVGMSKEFSTTLEERPDNVIIHEFLDTLEIRELLSQSQYYLQMSVSEGFPNALCEAMLCECIPIVSKVGAMPEIVKDAGLIIEHRDINLLIKEISKVTVYPHAERKTLGERARQLINERFPIEKREKEFLSLLE